MILYIKLIAIVKHVHPQQESNLAAILGARKACKGSDAQPIGSTAEAQLLWEHLFICRYVGQTHVWVRLQRVKTRENWVTMAA